MSLADLQNKQTMVYEPDKVSEYSYYWYISRKRFVTGSRKELKIMQKG